MNSITSQPRAVIIAVGSEILQGKIIDTNSAAISTFLSRRGIHVVKHVSSPDDRKILDEAIAGAAEIADLVLFCGGLGPTQDDITLEAAARFLNRPLDFDEAMWQIICERMRRYGREIPPSNRKQALLPQGGDFIRNPRGTAPGVVMESEGKLFLLLPGPPRETLPLLEEAVEPLLQKHFALTPLVERIFRLYNTGESRVQEILTGLTLQGELGIYFKTEGWIELHFPFPREEEIQAVLSALKEEGILATEDKAISLLVKELLEARGYTLGFAESLTGGNLTAEMVQNPGASLVLKGGIIAYTNQVKKDLLSVNGKTLEERGAVSEETAAEMAAGAERLLGCSAAVAVSGIAGPDGGSEETPVGTVCFAFLLPGDLVVTRKKNFGGDRGQVIRRTVMYAYTKLYRLLKES